jgi:hypothetical protein
VLSAVPTFSVVHAARESSRSDAMEMNGFIIVLKK